MYGFLNLFLAATFLRAGMSDADAEALLEEGSAESLRVSDERSTWRGHRLDAETDPSRPRADGIISFGSCSFTEPIGRSSTSLGAAQA